MKTKILVALFVAAALITGCEDKKAGDDDDGKDKSAEKKDKKDKKDGDKADGDIPAACQEYMDLWKKCSENLPAAAKPGMEEGYKAWKQSFDAATTPEAKKAMEGACKASADALKGNPACK